MQRFLLHLTLVNDDELEPEPESEILFVSFEGIQFSDGTLALNDDLPYTVYPGIPSFRSLDEMIQQQKNFTNYISHTLEWID